MKPIIKFFKQDSFLTGIVSVAITEVLSATILTIGLIVFNQPLLTHIRWYGIVFLFALIIVRYYAKGGQTKSLKAAIALFFISFVVFVYYLFATNQLELK